VSVGECCGASRRGRVAQLVRALVSHTRGPGFESLRDHVERHLRWRFFVPEYAERIAPLEDRIPVSQRRKLRVAIVVPALAARGGLASVALFLYRTIDASERYEPHLISLATSSSDDQSMRLFAPASWRGGPRIVAKKFDGIPYLHVGSAGAEIEPLRYRPRRALSDLLEAYDLVQLVAGSPALAHIARTVRRPVALQCATMVAVERRSLLKGYGLGTAWRRLMTAIVARMDETGLHHADIVLVENAWMRERVTKAIGAERVRFSPPGVDTTLFHPDSRCESEIVLAVGRLDDPRKNIPMLLEAFALARTKMSKRVRLVLAGERGPGGQLAALAARLGVGDAVDIRLSLPVQELALLYRRAAVFALSSDEEGLGIAGLEAMASGVPVVCTQCGGPETFVIDGETGFLVPIGDSHAFADRLVTLFANPSLRQRMGEAARRHVERAFSLEHTGKAFLAAYDELLTGRAGKLSAHHASRRPT
jgi:glycosyltransferase involved in cell wall biosynthesis